MKKIEGDSKKYKDIPDPQIERINIVKIAILLKAIYRFKCNQNTQDIFCRTRTNNPKVYME